MQAEAATDAHSETSGIFFRGLSSGVDPRGTKILARTIYRELRQAGLDERDVVAIATELLGQTASELKSGR